MDRYRHRCGNVGDVQLHHLITGALAHVLHIHTDGERVARANGLGAQLKVTIRKGGVTQSIAEGKQRLPREVAIGAACHPVVLKRRQVLHRLVERHRQPSTGIIIAKENIGDGVSAGLSGIPGLDDSRDVLRRPLHSQGATVQQHQHHRFAQGVDALE